MQSSAAISVSASSVVAAGPRSGAARRAGGVRVRGFRGEVFACPSLRISPRTPTRAPVARASANGAVAGGGGFDYDLVIIGAGVGGHGAALHAVEEGLKTAVIEGDVVGGTCVNRGCVPSKALLAVSGRMRELHDEHHMKSLGLQVSSAAYDRQGVADHANNLASKIRSNLTNSMKALGVDILTGVGTIVGKQKVRYGKVGFPEKEITARNIIIATGSVPFVPQGIEIDGKTVFTSDHALKLESVPDWIAIVGSGYIGLEFSDVYTALGSEVTFVEALDQLMPGFDPEIAKLAQRVLINPRKIDYHTGVFASKITPAKDGKPVLIELIDAKTREHKETLEVDAALIATGRAPFTKGLGLDNINVATQRGFVPVDEQMRVMDADGNVVPNMYCIGDANGKLMLAHAASAQGISVVEQISGRDHILNHLSIPAACFTHPEISMVGLTEPQAREKGDKEGFEVNVVKTSFKANTKALAENEGDGIAKLIYRPDTGEILGVHILGLHAADLIHEASNAIALGTRVQDIKFAVHAHPTLSEVLDELFKAAKHGRFFPGKAAMLADRVLEELVKELKVRAVPVVFASFSGGPKGCTYKVLQLVERRCEGRLSPDEYQLVRDCLCGQMYDSGPVDFVSDLGTRFLLHPSVLKMSEPPRVLSWTAKGVASGLDILFISRFEEQRKEYWETLYTSVHVGPILIFCSVDDELAPCAIVQNFAQCLLELGGDVNLVKWKSSPHVGHYKHHPEEYQTAVTELLIKASTLYMSRRQHSGYEAGMIEQNDMHRSVTNPHRTAASSSDSIRRAPIDQFFLPSSMEYRESYEGPKPELFNMPSVKNMNPYGVLGQMLYDVCVPKNIEGWDLKPSAVMNGRQMHAVARHHGSFNPMKCIRRSRL